MPLSSSTWPTGSAAAPRDCLFARRWTSCRPPTRRACTGMMTKNPSARRSILNMPGSSSYLAAITSAATTRRWRNSSSEQAYKPIEPDQTRVQVARGPDGPHNLCGHWTRRAELVLPALVHWSLLRTRHHPVRAGGSGSNLLARGVRATGLQGLRRDVDGRVARARAEARADGSG